MATHLSMLQTAPEKIEALSDSVVLRNDSFKSRARVLFVVDEAAADGNPDFWLSAIKKLSLNGCKCYALVSKSGEFSKRLTQSGFYYFLLDSAPQPGVSNWRRTFPHVRKICDFLGRYRFDAVIHSGQADLPAVRLAAWMSGIPTRIGLAHDPAYLSSWAGEALEISTSNLDTQTVALSDWIAWKYKKLGMANVKQHHLCSVDALNFDAKEFDFAAARAEVVSMLGIRNCTKLVCMFADIRPFYPRTPFFPEHLFGVLMHDSALFVQAMKSVIEEFPGAHFVVVGAQKDVHGQGFAGHLRDLAVKNGLAEHFHCLPESEDRQQLLAAADIVVQTSHLDVSPNIVRAMLMEKPVIATEIAEGPSIIEHKVTGLLIPPGDCLALSEAIKSLFDVKFSRTIAASGRQSMLQRAQYDDSDFFFFSQSIRTSSASSMPRMLHFARICLGLYVVFCFKLMLKAKASSSGKAGFTGRVYSKLASLTCRWLRYFTRGLNRVWR